MHYISYTVALFPQSSFSSSATYFPSRALRRAPAPFSIQIGPRPHDTQVQQWRVANTQKVTDTSDFPSHYGFRNSRLRRASLQ